MIWVRVDSCWVALLFSFLCFFGLSYFPSSTFSSSSYLHLPPSNQPKLLLSNFSLHKFNLKHQTEIQTSSIDFSPPSPKLNSNPKSLSNLLQPHLHHRTLTIDSSTESPLSPKPNLITILPPSHISIQLQSQIPTPTSFTTSPPKHWVFKLTELSSKRLHHSWVQLKTQPIFKTLIFSVFI